MTPSVLADKIRAFSKNRPGNLSVIARGFRRCRIRVGPDSSRPDIRAYRSTETQAKTAKPPFNCSDDRRELASCIEQCGRVLLPDALFARPRGRFRVDTSPLSMRFRPRLCPSGSRRPTAAFPSSERVRSARQATGACSSAGQALGRAAKRWRSRDEHHIPGYRVADPFPHRTLPRYDRGTAFILVVFLTIGQPNEDRDGKCRKATISRESKESRMHNIFDAIVTALPRIVRFASDRLGSSAIIPGERRSVRRNASSGSRRAGTWTAVGYSGSLRRTNRARPPRPGEERYRASTQSKT